MTLDILGPELAKHGTPRQCEYLDAVLKYGSNTKAAEHLGVGRRTVDRAISALKRAAVEAGTILQHDAKPRVLVLDIETAPMLANIWRMWEEVRNLDALVGDWYIMSFAAKWLGDNKGVAYALCDSPDYTPGSEDDGYLLAQLWALLDNTDYVITHNGDNFDIKRINTRFLEHGMRPVRPYKSIDTLKIAKRCFSFTSNKLEYIAQRLLGKGKAYNSGLPMWQACIRGEPEAWKMMIEYNKRDVEILEQVYHALRAWDQLHPSFAVHTNKEVLSCTVCGSDNVRPTGKTVKTASQAYLGYECDDCGHQLRGRTNVRNYAQQQSTLVNART